MRVLVAMSGGVDSSVAAARMVDAGHDVVGVHLALSPAPGTLRTGSRGCCSKEDAGDARRVADILDIPFYVWDFADRFKEDVIDDFVSSYARGETPNPCVRCNERIKFSALAARALALGFDAVATGHYARLSGGRLRRAVDAAKDQSYVLAVLTAEQLRHAVFPVGDTPKPQIRQEAARRGLAVADKPDSHDICFIPSGDTRTFLGTRIGVRRGPVVDATGAVLAEHDGVHGFTVGQRKGLGIAGPGPDGQPRYVTEIDPDTATVRVGAAADLDVWTLTGERPVFTSEWLPRGSSSVRCRCVPTAASATGWPSFGTAGSWSTCARRCAGWRRARPWCSTVPTRSATRCWVARRSRDSPSYSGTLARMLVMTIAGTESGNRHAVTSTSTTDFTR